MVKATIETLSKRFHKELLRKIPVGPSYTKLIFYARGVPDPDSEKKAARFEQMCRTHSVIPHKKDKFTYNHERKVFIQTGSEIRTYNFSSDEMHSLAADNTIEGGVPHKVEILINSGTGRNGGRAAFLAEIGKGGRLDKLLKEGYIPLQGVLGFELRSCRRVEKDYPLNWGGIHLLDGSTEMMLLTSCLYQESTQKERRAVAHWFRSLVKKYSKS